ncbi:MYND-type domain-containing protein [Mycena indigotica]|uniref:MYND-type domain-containing protein n=1 Tax=Mycena indigotica TaxID=2126181 RepID=A0A8H6SIL6_9AGAR|nr:MYND-type domain-containing protein [Mycena indigotica]KAF7299527.1 MYND-type domain-containing protein [Mycena indigotica]
MPHPLLSLRALQKLPVSQRLLAQKAMTGSTDALHRLYDLAYGTPSQGLSFLPVVNHLLAPQRIASFTAADDPHLLTHIAGLVFNLVDACDPLVPKSIYRALWPRMWDCVLAVEKLADTLYDSNPAEAQSILRETCSTLLVVLIPFLSTATPADLGGDPAVLYDLSRLSGRLWAELIQTTFSDSHRQQDLAVWLSSLYRLFGAMRGAKLPAAALIEGFESARTQIDFCKYIVDTIDDSDDEDVLCGLIAMACNIILVRPPASPWAKSLLHHGLLSAVARAFTRVCDLPPSPLSDGLRLIAISLTSSERWLYLPKALDAGLLRVLKQVIDNQNADTYVPVQQLLARLPGSLIYHPVMEALQRQQMDLDGGEATDDSDELHHVWAGFVALAKERLSILEEYQSGEHRPRRMCGSPTCGQIGLERDFRRCSGCSGTLYCDKKCQKVSWAHDHRDGGCALVAMMQHQYRGPAAPFRNKRAEGFLRLIVQRDYRSLKLDILRLTLGSLHSDVRNPPLIVFDYTASTGGRSIRLVPPTQESLVDIYGQSGLVPSLFRGPNKFSASDNDQYVLGLHHIAIMEQDTTYHVDWVLCSPRAAFVKQRLAEISAKMKALEVDVENLRDQAPEVYEELVMLSKEQLDEVYR